MNIQGYKLLALLRKDVKDALKNGNCMLLCILPLLLTAIYRFMDFGGFTLDQSFVLTIGLLMNMSMLPLSLTSMMIAEEKEKFTLRTLMLSNVSAGEFLLSKTLVIFGLMQTINLVIYALAGTETLAFAHFLLVVCACSLCMILLGALIGLLCKNQMSTGLYAAPLALLILMPAIFGQISEGIAKFARFLPSYAMMQLLSGQDVLLSAAVTLGWILLSAALFAFTYQKKRLD